MAEGAVSSGARILWAAPIALALAACAPTPQPVAPEASATPSGPIELGPDGSHPVVFQKVLFRIPSGTELGATHIRNQVVKELRWNTEAEETNQYNVAVSDELERWGYRVLDVSDAVFNPASTVKVRFQLAAIVHRIEVDYYFGRDRRGYVVSRGEGYGVAEMDVEVQVYDAVDKKIVFKRTYLGNGRDEGRNPEPIVGAILDGVRKALADPEFVAHLAIEGPGELARDASVRSGVTIPTCTAPELRLPGDMEAALEAVITVLVGATAGTGVLVSGAGHAITAGHVVSDQEEVSVRLHSGLEFPASVERIDGSRDVALLKLPGRGYPCLRVESTQSLATGSDVFVVGTPLGDDLALSVSRGVVSGQRELNGRQYVQTDASVNPGSSGGPMLDRSGRVRAVVVEKAFGIGIEGLAFGVPIEAVEQELVIDWSAEP